MDILGPFQDRYLHDRSPLPPIGWRVIWALAVAVIPTCLPVTHEPLCTKSTAIIVRRSSVKVRGWMVVSGLRFGKHEAEVTSGDIDQITELCQYRSVAGKV